MELAHLIDRLGARFGLRRVTRLVPQDTHIPEFAVMAVAALSAYPRSAASVAADREPVAFRTGSRSRDRFTLHARDTQQDSLAPTRPIRLFARPEPIEAIAEVPDGPPAQFTLAAGAHDVVRMSKGPSASRWNGGATSEAAR